MASKNPLMQFSKSSHNKYFNKIEPHSLSKDEEIDIFQGVTDPFDMKLIQPRRSMRNLQSSRQSMKQSHQQSDMGQPDKILHNQSYLIDKLITKSYDINTPLKQKYVKLCQQFGINFKRLSLLSHREEKEDYVINCMTANIQEHLKTFDYKIQTKQIGQREQDYKDQNQQDTKSLLNLYDWLQIRSQYYQLQKKLKYALVDAMNDTKNEKTVQQYFEKNRVELLSTQSHNSVEKTKVEFTTPRSYNSILKTGHRRAQTQQLSTHSTTQIQIEQNLVSSTKHSNFFQNMETNRNEPYNIQTNRNEPGFMFDSKETKFDMKASTDREPLKIDINTKMISPDNTPDIHFREWNLAIEKGFLAARSSAQERLTKEIKSSSWNRSGLYPLIYDEAKKSGGTGMNNQKREKLFNQHVNGDQLTSEELKFVTNTSYLINKGIDKKFIQRAINYLEEEVIQEVELNIAEQILKTYYDSHNLIKQKRFSWMKNKNDRKRIKINVEAIVQKNKKKKLDNAQQLVRIKEKLVAFLKDLDRKKMVQEKHEQNMRLKYKRSRGHPLQNRFVIKFKDLIMTMVKKKRILNGQQVYENFFIRNGPKSPLKTMFNVDNQDQNVNEIQRLFHPSSKVLTQPEIKETTNMVKYQKQNLINRKEHLKFKLGIKNSNFKINTFKEFYSGGPAQERPYASPEIQVLNQDDDGTLQHQRCKWINASVEEIAVNKIKRAYRYYTYKKQYQKLLEQKQIIKNRVLEKQIQKCLDAKKLFELMREAIKQDRAEKQLQIRSGSTRTTIKKQSKILTPRLIEKVSPPQSTASNFKQQTEQKLQNQYSKQKEVSDNKLKHRKLIIAAKMGNLMIALTAGYIFNKGDVNCYDGVGNCPLYYCAINGDDKFCKFLLNLGANVNQRCRQGLILFVIEGNTPVHMAFKTGKIGIIIEFIHKGADLNLLNDQNHTPIAFGSDSLLTKLNLSGEISAIADLTRSRTMDNNEAYNKKFAITTEYEILAAEIQMTNVSDGLKILSMKNKAFVLEKQNTITQLSPTRQSKLLSLNSN